MTSATQALPDPTTLTGSQRYARTAESFHGVTLTREQRRVLEALAEHDRVHVESGNGVGKSFVAGVANGAFLLRHPDSICMATSGTYSVLNDVLWKPLRRLWNRQGLPGRTLESPPRIRIDDEWYFKAVAPRHPGNLEGRHAGQMLVTIEEVDKPDITGDHFDSAESMLTGGEDRLLAISNPPDDEGNVAHRLSESDRWHTIRFSSFDSHNVRVDAGEIDAGRIEGLVGLDTIRKDWENWNGEDWPGLDDARSAHERRDDLDERWYRRRAGVMPPQNAATHRPINLATVTDAFDADATPARETPLAIGIDVARKGGDRTTLVGFHGDHYVVHGAWQETDHTVNEQTIAPTLSEWPTVPVAVDATGEGSGLADRLDARFPEVERFDGGTTATDETSYYFKRGEALAKLGDTLDDGATVAHQDLYEELSITARTVAWEKRPLQSRGRDGATVYRATSKDEVKAQLGRSPDYVDAAAMAAWVHATDGEQNDRAQSATIPW